MPYAALCGNMFFFNASEGLFLLIIDVSCTKERRSANAAVNLTETIEEFVEVLGMVFYSLEKTSRIEGRRWAEKES